MSTRREVEVDTALAELHLQLAKTQESLNQNKLTLARYAGIKAVYVTRNRREVRESAVEIAATLAGMIADGKIARWDESHALNALAKREELLGEAHRIRVAMAPLNDEYDAQPWSRFFLVTNHSGHIHSSMHCSTCHPTTSFGWLPELSGLTEKDAVDAHGPLLCSVCYPTAPIEWTVGKTPKDDPNTCPASGKYVRENRRYVACPSCGASTNVTSTGKLRTHKKPVAA